MDRSDMTDKEHLERISDYMMANTVRFKDQPMWKYLYQLVQKDIKEKEWNEK